MAMRAMPMSVPVIMRVAVPGMAMSMPVADRRLPSLAPYRLRRQGRGMVKTVLLYPIAAIAEIGGCFALWAVIRLDRSPLWLVAGMAALLLFAVLLAFTPADNAGRAFAAYGGVYIVASLAWLWAVEGVRPDRWDASGGLLCLIGAGVILLGPRD